MEQRAAAGTQRILENFLPTITSTTSNHTDTLPRIGSAPLSATFSQISRSRENQRPGESVLVGRGRGGHGMRSLSPWARRARRGSRRTRGERKRGVDRRTCTHTKHAFTMLASSATHSTTSRRADRASSMQRTRSLCSLYLDDYLCQLPEWNVDKV